jgi:predicted nucleic acid-binding protein
MTRALVDTNVVVYAFSTDARSAAALALLAQGCDISLQSLNEFANVARRKLRMSWPDVREALAAIRTVCRNVVR